MFRADIYTYTLLKDFFFFYFVVKFRSFEDTGRNAISNNI